MATTVSSVWAKPGAWALDSEQHEEELQQDLPPKVDPTPTTDFPSLSAAVTTKPKKKNKAQTLSLAQFATYKPTPQPDPTLSLPTAPRQRTAEELEQTRRGLGGGFLSYGDRDNKRDGNRERPEREPREPMGPSRADEADDWSRGKKFGSSFGPDRDNNRERDNGPSRADEVDDWSKGKRFSSGGGERREKMGFFNSSRADEVGNWAANKSYAPPPPSLERRGMGFERSGPGADGDKWVRNEISNVGGGGGRPRLNLQPRTLPVASNGNGASPGEGKEKRGGNPFGEARPREEVLKEKGQDWKEIDEKLEAVKLKEEGSESFGRWKGFGLSRNSEAGEDRSVRAWRRPDSNVAVASPSPRLSGNTTEKTADTSEVTESNDKVPEEAN